MLYCIAIVFVAGKAAKIVAISIQDFKAAGRTINLK
jgi:hypothetical protein